MCYNNYNRIIVFTKSLGKPGLFFDENGDLIRSE